MFRKDQSKPPRSFVKVGESQARIMQSCNAWADEFLLAPLPEIKTSNYVASADYSQNDLNAVRTHLGNLYAS
jgi:hypothetical protein